MRPITKIFLLLVAIFVVYLVWPRKPDLAGFDPARLAPSELKVWVAEKEGSALGMLRESFMVYTQEFGFSPVAAFRVAQSDSTAALRMAKIAATDDIERESRVLPILREKYAIIRRETGVDFDPASAARNELHWRSIELDGRDFRGLGRPLSELWGNLYGKPAESLRSAANSVAFARLIAMGRELPDGVGDPRETAEEMAQRGYTMLKKAVWTEQPRAGE